MELMITNMIEKAVKTNVMALIESDLSPEDSVSIKFLINAYLPNFKKEYSSELSNWYRKDFHMSMWANQQKSELWKYKLVESLMIIQAYELVRNLGLNVTLLNQYLFPKLNSKSFYVHPVKKVLYNISESLSTEERKEIILSIIQEGKCASLKTDKFDVQYFEFFLMKLINVGYITLGTWTESHVGLSADEKEIKRCNVHDFALQLKKNKFYQLFDCLKMSEKLVNQKNNIGVDSESTLDSETAKMSLDAPNTESDEKLQSISLSLERLGYSECALEVFEKISFAFLLHDNTAEAQHQLSITNVILRADKNIKYKHYYNCEIDLFSNWMTSFPQRWREKLIESILIIDSKKIIRCFKLDNFRKYFFLPDFGSLKSFIHPVKRALYHLSGSLTEEIKKILIDSTIAEDASIKIDNSNFEYFESFLMKLIEFKYITLGTWNDIAGEGAPEKCDVQKLAVLLKRLGMLDSYNNLLDSENIVNQNVNYQHLQKTEMPSTGSTEIDSKFVMPPAGVTDIIGSGNFFNGLDECQLVSLIFLTGVDAYEQERRFAALSSLEHSGRIAEYISILNSWSQTVEHYECRVVESLLIIQAYDHLEMLHINIDILKNHFLPKCLKTYFFIPPLNKAVHAICRTLTEEHKKTMLAEIKELRENYSFEDEFCMRYCQLILLKHIVEENKAATPLFWMPPVSSVQSLIDAFEKAKLPHQIQLLLSSEIPMVTKDHHENFKNYLEHHLSSSNAVDFHDEELSKCISRIDYDTLQELENKFRLHQKISLVFLLYDDTDEARKRLTLNSPRAGAEAHTLKCYDFNLNLLSDWVPKSDELWREKIAEAILIIQADSQIERLNLKPLIEHFLPNCVEKKILIHPVKKALHLMCECLTSDRKRSIIKSISREEPAIISDTNDEKYFEIFILKLINANYISLSSRIEANALSLDKKDFLPSILERLISHLGENEEIKQSITRAVTLSNQEVGKYVYHIKNNKNMGYVVIIDQNSSHKLCRHVGEDEQGICDADQKNLVRIWKTFGFTPLIFENLDSKRMISTIKETVETEDVEKHHSAFVLCILSRGLKGDVYGSDDKLVTIDSIEEALHCSELRGKPKIIIIASHDDEQAKSPMTDHVIPEKSDILSLSSIVSNLVTCPERGKGSRFIRTICSNLEKSGNLIPLMRIWLDVNVELNKLVDREEDCSLITTSFRKYLYLERVKDSE